MKRLKNTIKEKTRYKRQRRIRVIMKINDYKIEINEEGKHELFAIRNTEKIYVGEVVGENAEEVETNAKQLLVSNNMELASINETIVEKEDFTDRKADLSYIRNQMRKIMRELGNDKLTIEQKKSMLGIYGTIVNAATVVTKACIVELAYDKFGQEL